MTINYIHAAHGVIYAALGVSMLSNIYNFFDIRTPIPGDLPYKWLIWFLIPPIVFSVLDKVRVIIMPKEHENVLKDQLLSPTALIAETVAWAIPNIIGGIIYAVAILIIYAIAMYVADVHIVSQLADFMGLKVADVKF
jgi:hypothetical protein